jgi:hypothetical protein
MKRAANAKGMSRMKPICAAMTVSLALLMPVAHANLLINELRPAQEAFKKSQDLCNGVLEHVQPLAEKEYPEAWIALGDIYKNCAKDGETQKFKTLFEVYSTAALLDSVSGSSGNKKTGARAWAYHRLWSLMYRATEVSGYRAQDYVREIHILAAAALFNGGKALCWRAGGNWLESRNGGCEVINQLANDYVYAANEEGWKSPLTNAPLKGTLLQIHRANESNHDKKEVKRVFDLAEKALAKNEKMAGKLVCTNNANFGGGIMALRQSLSESPFFGHCRHQDWSAMGKNLKVSGFNDYGLIVALPSGGWGLVDLDRLERLASDAATELGMDVGNIKKMDAFVNDLRTRVLKDVK